MSWNIVDMLKTRRVHAWDCTIVHPLPDFLGEDAWMPHPIEGLHLLEKLHLLLIGAILWEMHIQEITRYQNEQRPRVCTCTCMCKPARQAEPG